MSKAGTSGQSREPVGFGQIYRAARETPVSGIVVHRGAESGKFVSFLPKGTRVVIVNDPPPQATNVWTMPLNYAELERQMVPERERNAKTYESYGIGVELVDLANGFVREPAATARFDSFHAQERWDVILKHRG